MPSLTTTFTTFADLARSGSVATWVNPSNAKTSDSAFATTSTVSNSGYTDYLEATGLTTQIPANATITGIVITVQREDASGSTTDSVVELVVGGSLSGTNKATSTAWTASDTSVTYGSSTDLWGNALTAAQVNASNFGVVVSAAVSNGSAGTSGGTGGSG